MISGRNNKNNACWLVPGLRWSIARNASLLFVALPVVAGCQRGPALPELVPVEGTVTLEGVPIVEGAVSFHEEGASAGTGYCPTGETDESGKYRLFVQRQPGCPAGRYHVVVFANERIEYVPSVPPRLPRSIINRRYNDPRKTPLRVEVRRETPPGAYDLKLER
jgi:hypothetical protein